MPSDENSLADIADLLDAHGAAPVETWHPEHCGAIDIRIDRAGVWWHEGTRIRRDAMVDLFSRVLRREPDGSHVLVTPAEKLTIAVEDAPFIATDWRADGEGTDRRLAFHVERVGWVEAGAAHPLRLAAGKAFKPYLLVRGRLEALMTRSVAQDVVLASDEPGIWAGGVRFPYQPC